MGSDLKGRPGALPVLKGLEIRAISQGCEEGRRDEEGERKEGMHCGPPPASKRAGAHYEHLKAMNPIQNLFGTTSSPRLRDKSQPGTG